jgi:hypothetical protein
MSLFLGILAAAALAGGFTVYPWSSHSRSQTVIAIVLWAVGVVLAGGAGYLDYRRRKKPGGDGGGPTIVQPVDPRQSLEEMLVKEYNEGVAINHRHFVDDMKRDAPPWQTKVIALLQNSLVDQGCWLQFKQMGPESGRKLNNQLFDQTSYLAQILQAFPDYDLKATWRPPTPTDQ